MGKTAESSLKEKLLTVLEANFHGSYFEDRGDKRSGRVSGILIWDGFVGLEPIDRQTALGKIFEREFTPKEQKQLALILALTPEEIAAMRED